MNSLNNLNMKYSIEKQQLRYRWYHLKQWSGLTWFCVIMLILGLFWNAYLFIYIF